MHEIEATVTIWKCNSYQLLGRVVPTNLCDGIFTTAAIDNSDHNPSSSTAGEAFHGSSVTVIQHPVVHILVPKRKVCELIWSRKIET